MIEKINEYPCFFTRLLSTGEEYDNTAVTGYLNELVLGGNKLCNRMSFLVEVTMAPGSAL